MSDHTKTRAEHRTSLKETVHIEGDVPMKLSAPKVITWWIAVVLGALGLLGHLGAVGGLSAASFWLVAAGLVLLAVATLVRDL